MRKTYVFIFYRFSFSLPHTLCATHKKQFPSNIIKTIPKRTMYKGYWLVADMDGTLVPTPSRAGGQYFSFSESVRHFANAQVLSATVLAGRRRGPSPYKSTLPYLREFIGQGGSLCVVSTAGRRLLRQVYADLALALFPDYPPGRTAASAAPGRLLLCGFTGAVLFRSRPPAAAYHTAAAMAAGPVLPIGAGLEEWVDYRREGADGASTLMSPAQCDVAAAEGRSAVVRLFEHAAAEGGEPAAFFSAVLSRKYVAPYTSLLQRLRAEVPPSAAACFDAAPALRLDPCLSAHGYYLRETRDALVDCQRVPGADGAVAADAPCAQVTVMGIPACLFDAVYPPRRGAAPSLGCCAACEARRRAATERIEAAGLVVKSQPNSVVLHRRGMDKGTCVRWLLRHREALDFSLERALALGDVPATVDRPLAAFAPMRFVSLSPMADDGVHEGEGGDAEGDVSDAALRRNLCHVGGEEEGTACFLEQLLAACGGGSRHAGKLVF
ncbi:hypothetical protein STCU_08224 [Strigomonas culicis]|uniref:Uncharacterized protein n=1 Tax=Strigomonas culicis TaxID=28005 RepID=S9VGQ6_9TRYP|nr:hypothetical protein STCU_08224 [Strigomonas culicis]|eukprot:EPY22350.1 hypothetical protein STCU_08224 [Strigomonas culicis]